MEPLKGRPFPLGVTLSEQGANFAVRSEIADAIEVCLFDQGGQEERFELPERTAHVFHGCLRGVGPGQRYGLRVHGPWNPSEGLRCNGAKLLLDPYATAIDGQVGWGEEVFGHRFDEPGRLNEVDSAPYMPRCVITDPDFDWGEDVPPRCPWTRRSSTRLMSKVSPCAIPTYRSSFEVRMPGLAHPAVIEHLADLGVTAIELLPVHQFVQDAHLLEKGLRNYWGYNSIGFFAPHGQYCSTGTRRRPSR